MTLFRRFKVSCDICHTEELPLESKSEGAALHELVAKRWLIADKQFPDLVHYCPECQKTDQGAGNHD